MDAAAFLFTDKLLSQNQWTNKGLLTGDAAIQRGSFKPERYRTELCFSAMYHRVTSGYSTQTAESYIINILKLNDVD